MMENLYAERYAKDAAAPLYPVEFVVRAFLGTYPGLQMPKGEYGGKRILDLGYGDGRNMTLLKNLGMEIHGVEIAEDINRSAQGRLKSMGVEAELKVGTNAHLPYPDGYFQYVLACHSCYYVEKGDTFANNMAEIARVLEPEGYFIASLPMTDTFILKDSKPLEGHHFEITHDPYGLRKGVIFRAFASPQEVQETLSSEFHDFHIGYCDDDYWGINQKVWVVVCRKLNKTRR